MAELDDRPGTTPNDLGLLALRGGVGAVLLKEGLRKFFNFDTITGFMASDGWRMPRLATFMVATAETGGGAGLLLGLLTPLTACAVIAAMLCAWAETVSNRALWSNPFDYPFMLMLSGVAVLLMGAGTWSLDARLLGHIRWPVAVKVGLVVAAVLAAVVTWVALNGVNPIHFSTPAGRPRPAIIIC